MCIWVNVFICVLSGDRETCKKWKAEIVSYKRKQADINCSVPGKIIKMLDFYLDERKDAIRTVALMVEFLEPRWKLAIAAKYPDIISHNPGSVFFEKSLDELYA